MKTTTPTLTTCADCGQILDAFGICPNALPVDAAKMTAPVNCGKPELNVKRFKVADYARTA